MNISARRPGPLLALLALFLALIVPLMPAPVNAQPGCSVSSEGDTGDGTLRNAIAAGCSVITFETGVDEIVLISGSLVLNNSVDINGNDEDTVAIVRAETALEFSVFTVHPGVEAVFRGLTIAGGQTEEGGGIHNRGSLTVKNSIIESNEAIQGGGIYNSGGTVTIVDSTIQSNTSVESLDYPDRGGAGIYNFDGGEVIITNTIVTLNVVSGTGTNHGGGAIYNTGEDSTVTITGSTFSGNQSSYHGGAIYSRSNASVFIVDSVFTGNGSEAFGGGIFSHDARLDLSHSEISGNTALGGGGARLTNENISRIENTTFSDNRAQGTGGGISIGDAHVVIISSTIYDNQATSGSAIHRQEADSTYQLTGSIVASSTAGNVCNLPASSGTNNLSSGSTCLPVDTTNIVNTDPQLGDLTENGSPTRSHLPAANSPVIDAIADCTGLPEDDQRGFDRPHGDNCDIGAVEVRYTPIDVEDIIREATGPDGWQVDYSHIVTDINFSCTPPPGTWLGLGPTDVTCTSGDYNLPTGFTISVVDTTPPVLTLPANINETSPLPDGLEIEFAASAHDIVDETITPVCDWSSGDLFPLGTRTVTCTATDNEDNTSTASFTVTVLPEANLAPTIGRAPNTVIPTTNPAGTAVTYVPNVSSLIDDNLTVVCTPPSGSFFSMGTHTITCTVTDRFGLSDSMNFQIIVVFDDGSSPSPPPPVDPGEPQEPTEPEEPQEPEEPTDPEEPEMPDTSAFDDVWARTDLPVANGDVSRTWVWGPVPFSTLQEVPTELWEDYAEAPGGKRLVRYYDKARMEITDPDAPDSPWFVTNGLLVVELITGMMQVGDDTFIERTPADVVVAGDLDDPNSPTYADLADLLDPVESRVGETITERLNGAGLSDWIVQYAWFDDVTGHNIAAPFWAFMNSSGLVWVDDNLTTDLLFENPFYGTGRPVTEAYWVTVDVGGTPHDVLLQCFERRCLTYTPENDPGWQVEAGNVGLHYFIWRYGD